MALLKFKRSAVPAKVPALNDLALGELAINTYDGKVYTKKDDGTPAIVEIGGNASGITTITSTDGSVTVTGSGATRDLSVAVAGSTTNVLALVRNNTGATLAKGTVVYINGSLGQNSTVAKAIATSDATSAQTLGLMTANLANNATGYVTIIGLITNMDTSAFTDGQQLYLSPTTAGTFTATKPHAPNHMVYVAVVEHAHPTQGKLFVKVQNGYEMDELHDVSAQNPANNDGLFYNTSTSLWEKKSIPTALGYTPANKAGDTFTGGVYSSGQIRATGWWGSQSASATGLGVEIGQTGGRSYVLSYNRDAATYGPMSFEANDFLFTGVSGGYVSANTSFRAPIFYDSDNTGYYVDPNGVTNLGGVNDRPLRVLKTSGVNSTATIFENQYGDNSWGIVSEFRVGAGAGTDAPSILLSQGYNSNTWSVGFGFNDTDTFRIKHDHGWRNAGWGVTDFFIDRSGNATAVGSSRAPIFYDSNNTGFYVDPNTTSNFSRLSVAGRSMAGSATLDMSGLDQNTWYPVTIPIASARQTRLRIENALNSNAPSWSTHPSGFSCYVEWTSNGAGWGTIGVNRRVVDWRESFTTVQIVGGIDQLTQSSTEVIWLRGGGNYFFSADNDVNPTIRTSTYEINGQSVSPRTTTYNTPWTASTGQTGAAILYATSTITSATDVRAPIFYDSNDTSYYVDPNSTSVLNTVNTWGEISARRGDSGTILRSYNTSAGSPVQFYVNHNLGEVEIGNARGIVYGGGSYWQIANSVRAPIFYDSNDTAYYVDPNSNSNFVVVYASEYYNRGWFRTNDSDKGLYNQATGQHWYSDSGNYWNMGGGNLNGQGIRFRDNHQGTIRGYVYYDQSNNVGFLNNEGNWRARVVGGDYFLADGSSARAQIFYDSNNTGYYVDPAGFSQMSSANGMWMCGTGNPADTINGSTWYGTGRNNLDQVQLAGYYGIRLRTAGVVMDLAGDYAQINGSYRAPIFYDSNNTAYYLNPESTSVLWEAATYYLRNIEDVAVNHEYGLYFSNSRSTAYAIYREAGAWTHPYPDLRIAFHTGIKMGAAAGYGGMKFYTDYDMSSQVMSINNGADGVGGGNVFVNNVLVAAGDIRSQIFYDYNNTGYYLDASSTGTSLNVAGSIIAAGNVTAYSDIRIKANVETIPSALDKLDQIRGVTYTRTDLDDKEQRYAGVIAQEIEAVLPEAVRDLGDIKAVDYNATIALLIEAVKELALKVKTLEEKDN